MKETRTATFAGREYRYVVHEPDDIRATPGVEHLNGIADHPEGAAHATWGTFVDEAEVRERHWHFKPGDVVLDIGPAFGSYTLAAALQGARVYAFEPCEFCRSILARNIAANPELAPRIHVVPAGVHERTGWFDPDAGTWHESKRAPHMLQVCSLDELAATFDVIDAMKFDVEGAELGALLGGGATLRKHNARILIEEHEFKQAGIGAACEQRLREFGYLAPPVRVNHGAVNHAFYEGKSR